MNSRHHLCVGGPLDGQLMAKQDHIKQFEVALLPALPFTLYDPSNASAPVNETVDHVTYTLTRIDDGSLIWKA